MQPIGQLDPDQLIGVARTIALDSARENDIYLSPNALVGVDSLVKDRMESIQTRFAEGTLDFKQWQANVRKLAGLAAKEILKRGVKKLENPEDLISNVNATLKLYPFDC
jgi:hypothetical protein